MEQIVAHFSFFEISIFGQFSLHGKLLLSSLTEQPAEQKLLYNSRQLMHCSPLQICRCAEYLHLAWTSACSVKVFFLCVSSDHDLIPSSIASLLCHKTPAITSSRTHYRASIQKGSEFRCAGVGGIGNCQLLRVAIHVSWRRYVDFLIRNSNCQTQ